MGLISCRRQKHCRYDRAMKGENVGRRG